MDGCALLKKWLIAAFEYGVKKRAHDKDLMCGDQPSVLYQISGDTVVTTYRKHKPLLLPPDCEIIVSEMKMFSYVMTFSNYITDTSKLDAETGLDEFHRELQCKVRDFLDYLAKDVIRPNTFNRIKFEKIEPSHNTIDITYWYDAALFKAEPGYYQCIHANDMEGVPMDISFVNKPK